ncbi:hypothetical protein E2I00_019655 [Balaenoptera physalus]|uniref:FAD-binding PCMH-type domain-containing protein n=1 Tax=Balaenoptera physalus TaxID=9770 RepID=A0A643BRW2_BALPH|nr:hypothetical protein E2I00_019655 [Balaenoptera physalus]
MKYGCRGGGCSSCTVMVSRYNPETKKIQYPFHYPVTACLVPICCLYGAAVTTVEGVGSIKTRIHPVQVRAQWMVMSVYTLLRHHPEPTPEQITEALGGNLCRFTGYRPIVESGKTFCVICTRLYSEDEFQPLDPAQEPLFPPELINGRRSKQKKANVQGERTTWIIPINSNDLLERKTNFPKVPLVMGERCSSIKFKDEFHPVFISPVGLPELCFVDSTDDVNMKREDIFERVFPSSPCISLPSTLSLYSTTLLSGVTIGVGYSLAQLNDALHFIVSEQPKEKTKTYHAPLQHLRTLAGAQIRSMATLGHVVSRHKSSDLNPILAAGNATINRIPKEGEWQIPLDSHFLKKSPEASLKSEEVILSVYIHSTLYSDKCSLTCRPPQGSPARPERIWTVLDEIYIPPAAEGGLVEYSRALIISLLFKFYLKVRQGLNKVLVPKSIPIWSCKVNLYLQVQCLAHRDRMMHLTGTKYACGRGGCGACTVMVSTRDPASQEIRHFSVTVCRVPICSLYGAAVTTVKGVGSIKMRLHPVQERIAKSHGTRCRICTPGMVMPMYTLLKSHPQPSEEQLLAAMGVRSDLNKPTARQSQVIYATALGIGQFLQESNGCQQKGTGKCCLDQGEKDSSSLDRKSDICMELFAKEEFQPLDPTQGLIFPPELLRMAENPEKRTLAFHGKSVTWISPGTLKDLLELKAKHVEGPLILGNTSLGPALKSQGHFHPVLLSPARISELIMVSKTRDGLTIGAACSLARVKDIWAERVSEFPEKTQTCQAFLKHLKSLAGQQIWNMAVWGHIISRHCYSDLNPILAVGNTNLNLISEANIFLLGWRVQTWSQREFRSLRIFPILKRRWGELMLDEACRLLLDKVSLPGWAPGGRVAFKRTLVASFFFKFYLQVLQEQKKLVELFSVPNRRRYPEISHRFLSALEDFPVTVPQGVQRYQSVDSHQPLQDPVGRPILHLPGLKHATDEAVFCTLPGPDHLCCGCRDRCTDKAHKKIKVTCEELEPIIFTIEDAIKHNSFLRNPCWRTGTFLHGNTVSACYSKDRGQRTGHLRVSTGSSPRAEDSVLYFKHPINRITCHVKRVGGGLGGKVGGPAVSGLLQLWALSQLVTPFILFLIVGFMNNRQIKALDIECFINGGCTLDDSEQYYVNISFTSGNRISYTEAEKCIYKIPNLRFQGYACLTNLPSEMAFRGFGFPQGTLVTESCITAVAAKCGLPPEKWGGFTSLYFAIIFCLIITIDSISHPLQIREKNICRTVDKTIYKQAFNPETLIRCWNECLDKTFHNAAALVHIYTDGSILVTHGVNELGQGIRTKTLQVASRELKIPMSYMHICETSTAMVPNTIATAASIGSDVNGRAVQNACQILLKHLEPIIKKNPEGTCKDWKLLLNRVSLSATGSSRGYKAFVDWEKGKGDPFSYYVYGADCSEVETDRLTGAPKKIRTDIVMDACCSLNPATDIGQIEGSFIQGMGLYTTEEVKYSPEGVLYSRGPDEYRIPTISDVPEEFNVSMLPSSQTPLTIYSSKHLGVSGVFLGSSVFFTVTDAAAQHTEKET